MLVITQQLFSQIVRRVGQPLMEHLRSKLSHRYVLQRDVLTSVGSRPVSRMLPLTHTHLSGTGN